MWPAERLPSAAFQLDDYAAELVALFHEVGVGVLHSHAHARDQLLVTDVREACRAFELARDCLDQRVLLERLEHPAASLLDECGELLGGVALLADEQRIGHQVRRTFVHLIEGEGHGAMIDRCRPAEQFHAWRMGPWSSWSPAGGPPTGSPLARPRPEGRGSERPPGRGPPRPPLARCRPRAPDAWHGADPADRR